MQLMASRIYQPINPIIYLLSKQPKLNLCLQFERNEMPKPMKKNTLAIVFLCLVVAVWLLNRERQYDPNEAQLRFGQQVAESVSDFVVSLFGASVKLSANLDSSRRQSGRCKGEKANNEYQCRYKIIEKIVAGNVQSAADAIFSRAENRSKPELRVIAIWSSILIKVRKDGTQVEAAALEELVELLSVNTQDPGCKISLKSELVFHYLSFNQRELGEAFLRKLVPDPSVQGSECIWGASWFVALLKKVVLDEPFPDDLAQKNSYDLWVYSNTLLSILAVTSYDDIKNNLVESAMRYRGFLGMDEKAALNFLIVTIEDRDPKLKKELVARTKRL